MNHFITIDAIDFNESVNHAPAMQALTERVAQLETDKGIDNLQFDGNEEAFNERVIHAFEQSDLSILSEDDVQTIARNEINEDTIKSALGLGRYSNLMTDDDISDAITDALDYDDIASEVEGRLDGDNIAYNVVGTSVFERAVNEYVDEALAATKQAANTGTPAYVFPIRTLLTTITEELLRTQNLMGMPTNQRLLDALMAVNECVNTLPLLAEEEVNTQA